MEKISVVTISFNCKSLIEDTIKSVINQTYNKIEYIIIDGASKDGTVDVITKYKSSIDVVISEPDNGIYDAMNKGIKAASGDWIIFMNAGDSFYKNTVIEEFVEKINSDTIIAHGDIMYYAKYYKYINKPCEIEEMKHKMAVKHQATFTKLEYHKKHLFDSSFRSAGDYDFFYKAYFIDNVKFQYIPIVVANFDGSGTSNSNFWLSRKEDYKIWNKENDFFYLLKDNIILRSWSFKRWIKSHFMNETSIKEIERKNIMKQGFTPIEIK